MNKFFILLGLFFLLLQECYSNLFMDENNMYLEDESINLESLPLKKLLEMKRELRKKGNSYNPYNF